MIYTAEWNIGSYTKFFARVCDETGTVDMYQRAPVFDAILDLVGERPKLNRKQANELADFLKRRLG